MKKIVFVIVFLLLPFSANAQWKSESVQTAPIAGTLTGSLDVDLLALPASRTGLLADSIQPAEPKRYSPVTAGLLSAVVPGAGQFYTKNYLQSMAFFGVEVGMWIVCAVYNTKGNRETNNFQTYADQNWSVVRYVDWIHDVLPQFSISGIIISNDPNLPPWQRVDWTKLNALENEIGAGATSGAYYGFTHSLPERPDQQYYELIGKYPQYVGGWNDAWNGNTPLYTDNLSFAGSYAMDVSPNFLFYRNMRGQANSYYAVATTASRVLIVNHIFGALEAVWNAAHENHKMQLHAEIQPRALPDGEVEFTPSFSMAVDF